MHSALGCVFFLTIAYAAVASVVLWVALGRRNVPLDFTFVGLPGYLYWRCLKYPATGPLWTTVALSAGAASIVAVVAFVLYSVTAPR